MNRKEHEQALCDCLDNLLNKFSSVDRNIPDERMDAIHAKYDELIHLIEG